jgi:hypothetical protein
MDDQLDYAQMLEIPVNTVNVVKKTNFFKRKQKEKPNLKDKVVDSVNERVAETQSPVNDYVCTEDLSEPQMQNVTTKRDSEGIVLLAEGVAACLIAGGIFLTNIFVPNSVINTFFNKVTATEEEEVAYNTFTLTSVVSELSDATVSVADDGALCFTDKTLVYPICEGEISSITQSNGKYTVKVDHTSTFSSVFTGLDTVYSQVGDKVVSNIPFAYSGGENEVRVSLYDGQTQLNCYTLSGAIPVWTS